MAVSCYEALVRGWVDVDGLGAPPDVSPGIVRACHTTLERELRANFVPFSFKTNTNTGRITYDFPEPGAFAAALGVASDIDARERRDALWEKAPQ